MKHELIYWLHCTIENVPATVRDAVRVPIASLLVSKKRFYNSKAILFNTL